MTAATLPRPWRPPVMTRAQARLAGALARRRDPVVAAGFEILFGPAPDSVEDPVRFALSLGGGEGRLTVPGQLLRRVLDGLDPAAAAGDEALCLLLELTLEPVLARLEAAAPLLAARLHPEPQAAWPGGLALGLQCGDGGSGRLAARLALGEAAARAVTEALHRLGGGRRPLPGLAIPVHVRALVTDLTLAMLRALRQGDVILAASPGPSPGPDAPGGLLLVAGERICWRAERDGRRLVVVSPRLDARAVGLGEWMMTDDTPAPALDGPRLEGPRLEGSGRPAPADDPASLDELPVRLVFELGRLELPLAELEAIGPGHVFDLARGEEQPVDIVAHGRRIGRGRIVAVGDSLGVQVVWIGRDG